MHDSSTGQTLLRTGTFISCFGTVCRYDLKPEQINRTLNSNYFETASELNSNFKYITS